jgi:hypothetical protein
MSNDKQGEIGSGRDRKWGSRSPTSEPPRRLIVYLFLFFYMYIYTKQAVTVLKKAIADAKSAKVSTSKTKKSKAEKGKTEKVKTEKGTTEKASCQLLFPVEPSALEVAKWRKLKMGKWAKVAVVGVLEYLAAEVYIYIFSKYDIEICYSN